LSIKVRAAKHKLIITGLPSFIPRLKLKLWLSDIAEITEERIAEDFDNERGNGYALKVNSEEYEEWKAANGFDGRRGHKEGTLQSELDAGGFYTVAVQGLAATITLHEQLLYDRADHIEHYVASKVRGGALLTVKAADAAVAAEYLIDRAAELEAKLAMKKTRRTVRAVEAGLKVTPKRGGVSVRVA
jgi:hypothetical protein